MLRWGVTVRALERHITAMTKNLAKHKWGSVWVSNLKFLFTELAGAGSHSDKDFHEHFIENSDLWDLDIVIRCLWGKDILLQFCLGPDWAKDRRVKELKLEAMQVYDFRSVWAKHNLCDLRECY